MQIRESLRSSLRCIFHNKMRSFLTMLGIIIGIFSVIMLTSIGEGIKVQVKSQVESLGANLLYVLPGKVDIKPKTGSSKLGVQSVGFGHTKSNLTYNDVISLRNLKYIRAITGVYNSVDMLDTLKIYVSTTGVDSDLFKISKFDLLYGRVITRKEITEKAHVAVIGYEANKEIFGGGNSLGKIFKLNGIAYKVIGVLKYKKPEAMGPQADDLNVKIYLPITEVLERKNDKTISQIIIQAVSSQAVNTSEKTVSSTLLKFHQDIDFTILKQQDMLDAINTILSILTAGLGAIAAISLIVGGIGIMNIMLVSVTERTKEIGIRKAIGASETDIMVQFIIEAVFLSVLGCILGLLAGIAGTYLLPSLLPLVKTAVSVPAVITALLFAVLVGIFFGVYPAKKAAKLDPIAALRNE